MVYFNSFRYKFCKLFKVRKSSMLLIEAKKTRQTGISDVLLENYRSLFSKFSLNQTKCDKHETCDAYHLLMTSWYQPHGLHEAHLVHKFVYINIINLSILGYAAKTIVYAK